jgi:GDP-D-mannose dehydratase
MWQMLQQATPGDYVVATGTTHSLQDFVEAAFARVDLDWRRHIVNDASLCAPERAAHEPCQSREGARAARLEGEARDAGRGEVDDGGEGKGGHG